MSSTRSCWLTGVGARARAAVERVHPRDGYRRRSTDQVLARGPKPSPSCGEWQVPSGHGTEPNTWHELLGRSTHARPSCPTGARIAVQEYGCRIRSCWRASTARRPRHRVRVYQWALPMSSPLEQAISSDYAREVDRSCY